MLSLVSLQLISFFFVYFGPSKSLPLPSPRMVTSSGALICSDRVCNLGVPCTLHCIPSDQFIMICVHMYVPLNEHCVILHACYVHSILYKDLQLALALYVYTRV